jgi:acyl-CoA dehydrogenase
MRSFGNAIKKANAKSREALAAWQKEIKKNSFKNDADFRHSVSYHLSDQFDSIEFDRLEKELEAFAHTVLNEVEILVAENNRPENLPRIAKYDGIGNRIETIIHHPSYAASGNLIYGSRLLERMAKKGGLVEGLLFFFLSSQAGEAGHNCPIACSYGIIRVLQKIQDFPLKNFYLEKLTAPSYESNYTGAQFVTEVQGGSDIGNNTVEAYIDESDRWRISGEKWFCSNANADLILMTARYSPTIDGTKGLGLFLVPALLDSGERNRYTFRRLKDKLGTRSLATAEIDFHEAYAMPIGKPEEGFKILMENVLHSSRLFNTVSVLGMARRAYQIAYGYAKHRISFGRPIIDYPLVQENLARIKVENAALLASIFATAKLQDKYDREESEDHKAKLLLRLLVNLNKYLSSLWTVEHIHHCLDILAGNGTIETFSSIPLLLRDSIICENWEGTHNILRMQILRDILRYEIDEIFLNYLHLLFQGIESGNPYGKILQEKCKELNPKLKELKEAPPELQMLQIKGCVDDMGILFSATHLLLEAIDQEAKGNHSKISCLNYFVSLHVQKEINKSYSHLLEIIRCVSSTPIY